MQMTNFLLNVFKEHNIYIRTMSVEAGAWEPHTEADP